MQMQMILPKVELHKIADQFENLPHVHEDQFQVTIPVHGTCYFKHENKEWVLPPGEGLLLHPKDRHSFHIGPDASVMVIRAHDQSLAPEKFAGRREPMLRRHFDLAELSGQFQKWAAGMFNVDRNDWLALEETESQILHYLRGMLWGGTSEEAFKPGETVRDQHYARVLEYIHAHYTGQMSVDTLAAIALQSRYHFIRSFKSMTGLTPYQYVLQLRIKEAKEKLHRSAQTVTDISFSLGFSSTSQFYRIFSKIVGLTPEQYRMDRQ